MVGFDPGRSYHKIVDKLQQSVYEILGLFFGRTEQNGPQDPKVVKCMELTKELHSWFKEANKKNSVCCRVLTREFDMGKGEHKEQCIYFTGICAGKVAEIVIRELGLTNLDEIA